MCDYIPGGPSSTTNTSSNVEQSSHAAAAPTSAPTVGNSVVEFRLKNGLCHGCGAQIYLVGENGQFSPLTNAGVVLQGRCLYCYPDRLSTTRNQKQCGEILQIKRKSFNQFEDNPRLRKQPRVLLTEKSDSVQPDPVESSPSLARRQPISTSQLEDEAGIYDLGDSDCFDDDEDDDHGNLLEGEERKDRTGMRIRIRDHQQYVYTGRLTEGTRHKGKGVFRFLYRKGEHKGKEAEYEGEFEHGRMEGQGTSRDAAGCVYVGTFRRGAAHGRGKCTWSQQWEYEGEWVMDRREGRGTLRQLVEDGEVYTGEWKQDKWHGRGELKFAGGGRYLGDFKHHKLDGNGRVSFLFVKVAFVVICSISYGEDIRHSTSTLSMLFIFSIVRICRWQCLRRFIQE